MAAINVQPILDLTRDFITENLLQDTCSVYYTPFVEDDSGGYNPGTPVYRTYNNSVLIPCRVDPTRQYRELDIYTQEITVTDYFINFPYDFVMAVNDIVVHGGIEYQVRKLSDDATWKAVKKAYIVSVR